MKSLRYIAALLLCAAIVVGTLAYTSPVPSPPNIGGYYMLQADLHLHMFPGDDSNLAPWDLMREARRKRLDVIALTGHNQAWTGKLGRWISRWHGLPASPIVLSGEEIQSPRFHLLALGITDTIDWRMSAEATIDEIHRQGGFAIAAHPRYQYWRAYDAKTLKKLDAAEVLHPLVYMVRSGTTELRVFFKSGNFAAIGNSDYHGMGPIGLCRTLIFVSEISEKGVYDALRAHRTVVHDRGAYFGDPALIDVVKSNPSLLTPDPLVADVSYATVFSRCSGALGLMILVLVGPRARNQSGSKVR